MPARPSPAPRHLPKISQPCLSSKSWHPPTPLCSQRHRAALSLQDVSWKLVLGRKEPIGSSYRSRRLHPGSDAAAAPTQRAVRSGDTAAAAGGAGLALPELCRQGEPRDRSADCGGSGRPAGARPRCPHAAPRDQRRATQTEPAGDRGAARLSLLSSTGCRLPSVPRCPRGRIIASGRKHWKHLMFSHLRTLLVKEKGKDKWFGDNVKNI